MTNTKTIFGRVIVLFLGVSALLPLTAQDSTSSQAEYLDLAKLEPQNRFKFLIGEWSYKFNDGHGQTSYRAVGTGGAIQEILLSGFFRDTEFAASSVFIYVAAEKVWLQNWVDTLGNTLEGKGKLENYDSSDQPAMVIFFKLKDQHFKHVWFNITDDRFETDLYFSPDGETYNLIRQMPYIRKK